jgi:hypothetical protein
VAVVADPDDPIQFSAAMARMADEALRTPAAVEARKAWARNFSHEAAAKKYDDLISSMLSGSPPRDLIPGRL